MDHPLHELGLAVPGAAHDVAVLEAGLLADVERNRHLHERCERRPREIHLDYFRGRLLRLPRGDDEAVLQLVTVGVRREAGGDQEVGGIPLPQAQEEFQP